MLVEASPRLALLAALPWLAAAPAEASSCPHNELEDIPKVYPVEVVVEKPIDVNIYCPENTLLVIDDGLALDVTDAPTTVITRLTKTTTICTTVQQ